MEQVTVYCRERSCGEGRIVQENGRADIRITMDDPGDGLYRAALVGERGQLALGVLEPEGGRLTLRRRPYWRDVERLGTLRSVQAVCSFPFRKKGAWQRTEQPDQLVSGDFLRKRLAPLPCAWWRREGTELSLALPLEDEHPFPLVTFFCFGRMDTIGSCRCVIYTFDREERPL